MTDLERKWNINMVDQNILQKALVLLGADAGQMTPVVNSILDWIHPQGTARVEGTESHYYEGLNPPYEAKNGPVDDLSELLLVKNVTPEIYWGLNSTNHPPAAFQPRSDHFGLVGQAPNFNVGLADLFTPISSGKLNINTCSAEALQLIPGIDSAMAEGIVGGRSGEDDGSGLLGPYRNVQQVQRIPGLPLDMASRLAQFCDVRSRTFEVEITADVAGSSRKFYAIVVRNNPKDIQVLNFYWKI
jgi:general secretion pathway protein K